MADYKDENWLRNEYATKGRDMTAIADDFDVHHQTINYWLEKFGIEKRSRGFKSGEDNPAYKGDVDLECSWCGKAFTREPSNVKDDLTHGPYCSRECHNAHKAEYMSGENNHQYGVRGEDNATHGRTGEDHPMYGVRGDEHPNWKGGYDQGWRQGAEWRDTRRKALERDDFECVECGMQRDAHDETYGRDLEAHHITPVSDGGAKHDLENIVTLCIPCHREIHRTMTHNTNTERENSGV